VSSQNHHCQYILLSWSTFSFFTSTRLVVFSTIKIIKSKGKRADYPALRCLPFCGEIWWLWVRSRFGSFVLTTCILIHTAKTTHIAFGTVVVIVAWGGTSRQIRFILQHRHAAHGHSKQYQHNNLVHLSFRNHFF
jgi:hypothetical protein